MPSSTLRRMITTLAIAAATMMVASGCTLWTFGTNTVGQLGVGTTTGSNVPVEIGTAGDWVLGAESKGDFSCAIEEDRTLWCWGLGSDGQLGNGDTQSSSVPVQAGTASDWARISTAERIGPTGLASVEWKMAARRVMPSTLSS